MLKALRASERLENRAGRGSRGSHVVHKHDGAPRAPLEACVFYKAPRVEPLLA